MADRLVERAGPADAEALSALDRHIDPAWVRRCLAAGEYFVAREAGEIVGFLRFTWFWRTMPYMELIQVREDRRRDGIGSRLVAAWETAMRAAGAELLITSSMSDEPGPQVWHRRNGFSESGELTFGRLQQTPEVFFVKPI
ncbi:MAG: GNAT family N-acetyltransferase [Caulobacteraceae bacterium]|nr:GNAT family N-acetyltransferase [Caulobacteraceae bacterium]